MSLKIVNLTLLLVTEELESILGNYPAYPYRQAFTSSKLRQKLMAYVLSRIPNIYTVIEERQSPSINALLLDCCSEQIRHIESLIHTGIRDVIHRKDERPNPFLFQVINSISEPLH